MSAPTLERHLAALRQRMLHPTAYETALTYFLSDLAADLDVANLGRPAESSGLRAVLETALRQVFGGPQDLRGLVILHVPGKRFYHGCTAASGRLVTFFYCGILATGILGVIPGLQGATEVVRFRLALSPNPESEC